MVVLRYQAFAFSGFSLTIAAASRASRMDRGWLKIAMWPARGRFEVELNRRLAQFKMDPRSR